MSHQRWDAARAANSPVRKYKPVGPIGDAELNTNGYDSACRACGYVDCDCTWVAPPYGKTRSGVVLEYNAFVPKGRICWSSTSKILCGLLRLEEWEALQDALPPAPP